MITLYSDFNPRSHEGSDMVKHPFQLGAQISIHAPTKGATTVPHRFLQHPSDFNPRSHEGSDTITPPSLANSSISIHAPTKGATDADYIPWHLWTISIHAPTKGATRGVTTGL